MSIPKWSVCQHTNSICVLVPFFFSKEKISLVPTHTSITPMKLSSYFLITVITVVLVAMIISNAIDTPRSGKEDMALYVKAIDEALFRQFVDKVADLTNRNAWRKPELYPEVEALCAEWKPMAGMWKAGPE